MSPPLLALRVSAMAREVWSWNWRSWAGSCRGSGHVAQPRAFQKAFFWGGFGVFWRFLALGTICSLSGEGAGGCLQATVSVCPLCPLVCQPRDGSPWVRLTLGTGHPKDGSPWEWVTPGPTNLGDESRSPWRRVTSGPTNPGDRSPQGRITPNPTNPRDGSPHVQVTQGTGHPWCG